MKKMAIIFVNGMEKDSSKLVKFSTEAVMRAYSQLGRFERRRLDKDGFERVPVQVIDIQTLWGIWYNAEKFGLNHFLAGNQDSLDPMETVLVVGPEEPEKLNKLSPNLRLF